MPETSVDENCEFFVGKNEVRFSKNTNVSSPSGDAISTEQQRRRKKTGGMN
jgi:hypothetical protein